MLQTARLRPQNAVLSHFARWARAMPALKDCAAGNADLTTRPPSMAISYRLSISVSKRNSIVEIRISRWLGLIRLSRVCRSARTVPFVIVLLCSDQVQIGHTAA